MFTHFQKFLRHTYSQKEISLIIAQDETEQNDFLHMLTEKGFQQAYALPTLLTASTTPSKIFFVLREALSSDLYTFIKQYPEGKIEIRNQETGRLQETIPLYHDVTIIFITTIENLKKIHEAGFIILDKVGLTYQN